MRRTSFIEIIIHNCRKKPSKPNWPLIISILSALFTLGSLIIDYRAVYVHQIMPLLP